MQVGLTHDPATVFGQITDPPLLAWGAAASLTSPLQNLPVFLAEKNPAATIIMLPQEDRFFLRGEGLATASCWSHEPLPRRRTAARRRVLTRQ